MPNGAAGYVFAGVVNDVLHVVEDKGGVVAEKEEDVDDVADRALEQDVLEKTLHALVENPAL